MINFDDIAAVSPYLPLRLWPIDSTPNTFFLKIPETIIGKRSSLVFDPNCSMSTIVMDLHTLTVFSTSFYTFARRQKFLWKEVLA